MHKTNTFTTTFTINITAFPPKTGKAWPDTKKAELELRFVDGLLAGHVLRGVSVWENAKGELYMQAPARSYKDKNGATKYWNFLASMDRVSRERFSDMIVAEYHRELDAQMSQAGEADAEPEDDFQPPYDDPDMP